MHSIRVEISCLSAGQAERLACRWQPNAFCGQKPAPTLDGPRAEGQREEKITPVWPCEPLCGADGAGRHPRAHKNPLMALVEAVWRKAGTAARTRFHPKTESEPTDWKYSRRKNRRFCGAGSLTTARSAGSYGDFYVAVKWGQKQQAGITFAVTFPECLEAWTKSRGHAGDTYSFLLLCHTVPAGAPLRNCGAENNNRALALGGQLVTFLIIDAVSPGYWAHVVIYFAADKEAARCTTT